jgi:hypothetical protein
MRMADMLRENLVKQFPPGTARIDDAERYLTDAGAKCGPAEGARHCTYTLRRPPIGPSGRPVPGKAFIRFDVDLIPRGELVGDVRTTAN